MIGPARLRQAAVAALVALTLASSGGLPTVRAAQPADAERSWIVSLKARVDPGRQAARLAREAGGASGATFEHALNGFVFRGPDRAAAALRRNPNVRSVVADQPVQIAAETTPPGIRRIDARHPTADDAHGSDFTGAGVRIAILDTGIDLDHPDLAANLDVALGRNCYGSGPPEDGHGHGTHVAGTAAAVADNGAGVVGVAPHARLVPIKVLSDSGSGAWSNVICGIDYLTGLAQDGNPDNDVLIANMSLGDTGSLGNCADGGLREAICTSVAAGVTYIAAAGNSTTNASTFIPAAFPEVITVSATVDLDGEPGGAAGCDLLNFYCDDTLAEFSNYGLVVDVAAPGYNIQSAWIGGGYQLNSGTSMAAPHVAGVAALVKSANPGLSPAAIQELLESTGECPNGQYADADGTGTCSGKGQWDNDPDGYGEPLVNALRAAEAAAGFSARPNVQITNPEDGETVSGVVQITATATSDEGVAEVAFAVNGIELAADTNGSNGWSAAWDTAGLHGGTYSVTATATDTTGRTGSAHVSVEVAPNVQGSWVGNYGADGYILSSWNGTTADLAQLPAGVSYSLEQGSRYAGWTSPTTDVRALESPDQSERRPRTWFHASQVRLRLNFTQAYEGTLHLYALDWDTTARRQTVTVEVGSAGGSVNLTRSFNQGAWLHLPVVVPSDGSVVIKVDRQAGANSVLAGIFLGDGWTPPPPPPGPPPPSVDLPGVQGNWVSNHGREGYILAAWNGADADLALLPKGVSYVIEQGTRYAGWASPTTNVRALESPDESERRPRTWYHSSQVRLRLNYTQAYSGNLHLYAVDWDTTARRQNVTVNDGRGPRTVQLTSSFNAGAWLHYQVEVAAGGSVVITVDRTAGSNSVLAGIFLGDAWTSLPRPTEDRPGVQGNWVGNYGADGYVLAAWNGTSGDLAQLPAGVTYAIEQGSRYAGWPSPTTDVRALESPDESERRPRTWFHANQLRLRFMFTQAYSGSLHLYALDWDTTARRQMVTVHDGRGPQLASLTTSFNAGAWLHYTVDVGPGGSLVIAVDRTAGANGVLAGIFLGGASAPAANEVENPAPSEPASPATTEPGPTLSAPPATVEPATTAPEPSLSAPPATVEPTTTAPEPQPSPVGP
ncbi:MAG TPA: S8 family serine peptidase [Candidatus Limnocylindria bacterium]|nr:S8 family serine peptidase [Candidatus Limnocylindria bacterium]